MTCTCTKPYSSHVEPVTRSGKRAVSHVDGYGQPLPGRRHVFRCEHGREMTWDGRSYVVAQDGGAQ